MATKREATGADDAGTAVTTSELGLVLLVGAAVVLAAIVAARVAHGIGPGRCLPTHRCQQMPPATAAVITAQAAAGRAR